MEEKQGVFIECKEVRFKNYCVPPVEDKDINSFCWKLRDDIDKLIGFSFYPGQKLSNK